MVAFDPDDLEAAYAELDERYAAGEAAPFAQSAAGVRAFSRALASRDWDTMAALYAPDFVMRDHRPLGWETLSGPSAHVETLRSLIDLAPDAQLRIDHATVSDRTVLLVFTWVGTREGGAFEIAKVAVSEVDDVGMIRCIDQYDVDQFDAARARFVALCPDPLRIPPNAATRARDRIATPLEARDWAALRGLASDDFTYEDRGKRAQVSGDVETWIKSMQFTVSAPGFHAEREPISTVGNRIAVERLVWTGEPGAGAFEIEHIRLLEVDAEERLRASILFDPDDRRAAIAEAQARFVAGEAASIGGQAPIAALLRAFAQHDWKTLRGCLADDAVLHDRRTPGIIGVLGRDEWIESWRVLADLAPDVDYEWFRILAWNRHGRVAVARMFGTRRDGGPFENVVVAVVLTDGDRIQRYEFFDVGDADQALARFAELCADLA
jgi:ketosteroid isomerase-like protein